MKVIKTLIKNFLKKRGYHILPITTWHDGEYSDYLIWLKEYKIDTVIDVGAHEGGFAMKIRAQFPNVFIHSFEPVKETYNKLIENFKNDKLFAGYNYGLNDDNSEIDFYKNNFTGASSALEVTEKGKEYFPIIKDTKKITIKTQKLDDIFDENSMKNKNILLKIDVQGFEDKVLSGAKNFLKYVKIIHVEVSFTDIYVNQPTFDDIYKILNNNFGLAGMEKIARHSTTGQFLQADAYFIKK